MRKGWIGVDLDGTLAHYNGWKGAGEIGEPVPAMLERVKKWLSEGYDVRVVTARMSIPSQRGEFLVAFSLWCEKHVGRILIATNEKDYAMIELWDDRAVAVEHNTGRILGGSARYEQAH